MMSNIEVTNNYYRMLWLYYFLKPLHLKTNLGGSLIFNRLTDRKSEKLSASQLFNSQDSCKRIVATNHNH